MLASTSASTTSGDPLPPRGNRPPRVQQALPRHALYGRSRYSSAARVGEEDETTWRERQTERELERRRCASTLSLPTLLLRRTGAR